MTKGDIRKEFGAAIRAHRQRLGMSQETLAERAQLHRTYVTDVERGARNISLESISRLANGLELSISALFFPTQTDGKQPAPVSAVQQSLDILLVEDDAKHVELALKAFAAAGLSNPVEVLRDGAAALDFLFARGAYAHRREAPRPLIMLLDLHLPKLHGLEVLRNVRKDARTRTLQVVVLTNSGDNTEVREALRLGAEAYLIKPLSFKSFSSVTPELNFAWTLLNEPGPGTRSSRRSLKRRAK